MSSCFRNCVLCVIERASSSRYKTCAKCRAYNKDKGRRRRTRLCAQGFCSWCGKRPSIHEKGLCGPCRARARRYSTAEEGSQRTLQRLRDDVFNAYGGYICRCCGETTRQFLTLDHMNNDGAAHRKEVGAGTATLRWVRAHNFPDGYQILCYNCNCGRARNKGTCPHKNLKP